MGLILTIIFHAKRQKAGKNKRLNSSTGTFMFKDLRSILIAFCFSLLAFNIFYLLSNIVTVSISDIGATIFAVLLHFSIMVSFLYMLSLGICQYIIYNKTFTIIYNYTKISFGICLGAPLIIVIITLAIDVKNYQQRLDNRYLFYILLFGNLTLI